MIITTTGMLTTTTTINTDRNVTTTVHNIARLQGKIMGIIGIIIEMRITLQMNETMPVIIITLMVGIKDITMMFSVSDILKLNPFTRKDIGSIQKVCINGDTSLVVEVGIGDAGEVDLRLELRA